MNVVGTRTRRHTIWLIPTSQTLTCTIALPSVAGAVGFPAVVTSSQITDLSGRPTDHHYSVTNAMSQELDHLKPDEPAPATGAYSEQNVFGTPTGQRIDVIKGDLMPQAPRDFTWRLAGQSFPD